MAYDRQFLSVNFLFQDTSSDEVAVTGLNFSAGSAWAGAEAALAQIDADASICEDLLIVMDTLMSTTTLNWANYSQLYGIKIAAMSTAGTYLTEPVTAAAVGSHVGTVGATQPQLTVCISLRSGQTLGRANYGRMYLPHTKLGLGSVSSTSVQSVVDDLANAAAAAVNGFTSLINGVTTPDVTPMIMTNTAPSASKPVVEVRVGTVTDTQQRRRHQLTELYGITSL